MTADGSGIEWDMLTSSTSKGPMVRRLPIGMISRGKSRSMPISPSFDLSMAAVKGVAKTGTPPSRGHRSTTAPKWSSWA